MAADLSATTDAAAIAKPSRYLQHSSKHFAGYLVQLDTYIRRLDDAGDLLDDILTSPEIRRRADNLLRRTLPRLAEAVDTYVDYAERGTDLVDPTEMRDRLIGTLENAAKQAERVRIDAVEGAESNVEVALDVLESSFAYERR